MDSRVSLREMLALSLVILAFTVTGIFIMNEDYKKALVALCLAAFAVLFAFISVIVGDDNKILDLSNPSLRNPRRSGKNPIADFTGGMSGSVSNLAAAGVTSKSTKSKPTKKKKSSKVTYVTSLVPKEEDFDDLGVLPNSLKSEIKTRKRGQSTIDFDLKDSSEFTGFGESVGNMRVYKRGEKIEFNDED